MPYFVKAGGSKISIMIIVHPPPSETRSEVSANPSAHPWCCANSLYQHTMTIPAIFANLQNCTTFTPIKRML